MTAESPQVALADSAPDQSLTSTRGHLGDTIFKGISAGSGGLILVILAAVALFLIVQAMPAFLGDPRYQHYGNTWTYVAPYLFGTVWASFLALLIAVPVAVGIALYISHYAPKRLSTPVAFVIDLLAAVPSVVFGLWGINTLAPMLVPIYQWLNTHFGWIPLFAGTVSGTGRTMLTAALVLAIMILPIITSLSREVFLRTPGLQEEASLALGATRWEMVRQVVLPFGRSGIVSASMLGLGRALGETMAVTFVIGNMNQLNSLSLFEAANSITSALANEFAEAGEGLHQASLMYLGLVLFFITFVVLALSKLLLGRLKKAEGGRA